MPPAHARHTSGHPAATPDSGAGRARPRYGTAQRRLLAVSTGLGVAVLAGAAFVLSYDDLRVLALEGHAARRWAPAYPIMVDALIVVTILALVVARHARWWTRWPRWILLLLLIAGPAAASVQRSVKGYAPLPDQPLKVGVAVAPYVLLLVAAWLWLTMFRQMHRVQAARPDVAAPAPPPDAPAPPPAAVVEPVQAHEPGRDLLPEPVPAPRPEPLALPSEHDDLVPGMTPPRRHPAGHPEVLEEAHADAREPAPEPLLEPLPQRVRQPAAPEPWLDVAETEPVLQGPERRQESGAPAIATAAGAEAQAAPAPVQEPAATASHADQADDTVPAGGADGAADADDADGQDERREPPRQTPLEPAAAAPEPTAPSEPTQPNEPTAPSGPTAPAEPAIRAPYSLPTDVRLVSRPQRQEPSLAATTQPDMFLPDLMGGQEADTTGTTGTTGTGDASETGDASDESDATAGLADDRAEDPDAGDDVATDRNAHAMAVAGTDPTATSRGTANESTHESMDESVADPVEESMDDSDQWSALGAGDVHLIADDLDASSGDPFFDEAGEEDLDWTPPPSSRFRSSPTPPGEPR